MPELKTMAQFVHLHNHSEYSLLDGLSHVTTMAKRAKELDMPALAITDHGSMYGVIYFYKACLEEGIKPIIGCEIYITARSRHSKEAGVDKDYNHLILLAENNTGYKNLMKIVSRAYLEGYYYKPRTDLELLKEHHEGLICLSACVNGFVSDPLLRGEQEEAERRAKKLSEIFGPDHFYLELQKHTHVPPQEQLNPKLIELSKKMGIPLVATNDNHYTYNTDAQAQEILLCIQTGTTIDQPGRKLSMIDSPDFYLKSADEMATLFPDIPEALENTVKIAERCNVEITLGKWIMPKYDAPDNLSLEDYLNQLVWEGAKFRYGEITPEIKERIEYELDIINTKGYATYFLTVQDFVNWAKDHNISVGPGRGSAAGSVVSYCLKITDIDPFFFKLPFERFLNPLRPSAPDIDLDFADTRREEVIQYVTQKYGEDKVAQIITFGTMEAKGSVRDVGRALGMPYAGPDRISKMIPPGWQGHAMTLDNALDQSPDLKRAYLQEEDTKRLIDLSKKIEGVVRHASVHAAGVVIADAPITEYCPVQREPNGEKVVTQYDMYTVGEDGVGLLKMDFLGLRNLTIIEESLKWIKGNKGVDIDISKLPIDDTLTYELLSRAETTGIFQFESAGMRRYIKELKPSTIFDLMAMNALYRPGPMQNIPAFIARKNNPALIDYPDPRLKEILSQSYGILTYQDDVLLTTIELAGYTWLDADKFRKAMGKKIPAEMKKQKEQFIAGAQKHGGLTQKKAEEIFELIAPFAGYGFNKAHAACYATIAYRTAYLKAHFPVEFMTALLTAESRGTTGPTKNEKIAQIVAECKRLTIEVLPPDINLSHAEFAIEDKTKIRFGLSAIKNVGEAAIATILDARSSKPFISFQDFCKRVELGAVNKKTLESLIKAGALDKFGNRAMLLASMAETTENIIKHKKNQADGQSSLFGEEDTQDVYESTLNMDMDDFSHSEKLGFEKEFLGFYLTAHPQADNLQLTKSKISHEMELLQDDIDGQVVKVGGIVDSIKRIFTKKSNAEMAFATLSDEKGLSVEVIFFPKIWEQYKDQIYNDSVLIVEGKVDMKNDKPVILVQSISKVN